MVECRPHKKTRSKEKVKRINDEPMDITDNLSTLKSGYYYYTKKKIIGSL